MTSEQQLDELVSRELVEIVHSACSAICRAKGYAVTPKESDVLLVLQALRVVRIASRRMGDTDAT